MHPREYNILTEGNIKSTVLQDFQRKNYSIYKCMRISLQEILILVLQEDFQSWMDWDTTCQRVTTLREIQGRSLRPGDSEAVP